MELKKILVPTDFSSCADDALKVAVDIAKQSDASIYLLTILSPSEKNKGQEGQVIDVKETPSTGKEMLEDARAKIKARMDRYEDISIDGGVSFDLVSRQVFEFVGSKDVDLIVMGSHGASGMKEITIGSNTQKVVRNADVPVLVIKHGESDFMPRNIIFPSDFEHPTRHNLTASFLKEMTTWFSSTVHLLKIITPNNFEITSTSEALMEKFAEYHELSDYTVNTYNSYNEEEGILNFAEENKGDLIAMNTHGRKGIMHILMGSITENITNQSKMPILTFKLDKK